MSEIQFDAKKDGLRQLQDGSWKVSLTVHPNDFDNEANKPFLTTPMGTRYMVVMVEIGDDEQPAEKPARKPIETGAEASWNDVETKKARAKARRSWDELSPSQQAGIACNETSFILWTRTSNAEEAAQFVRSRCGVTSRSLFDQNEALAARWATLYQQFRIETGREAEER